MQIHVHTVLGRAHEELKERNQAPSVAWEQLVSETLFHLLYILDTFNQLVNESSSSFSSTTCSAPSCTITSAILLYLHAQLCASASSLSGHQHVAHELTEHRQLTATSAPSMLRESRYALLLRTCKLFFSIMYYVRKTTSHVNTMYIHAYTMYLHEYILYVQYTSELRLRTVM